MVCVSVQGEGLQRGQWFPSHKYFSRLRVRDVITMLQPNLTEIIEGKVKKYDIRVRQR